MNYRSYEDLVNDTRALIKKLRPPYRGVVSIPRSGNIAASIIALHFNIPFYTVDEISLSGGLKENSLSGRQKGLPRDGKLIIVDDSCNSGRRVNLSKEAINQLGFECEVAVLYAHQHVINIPDYYVHLINQPRSFEWNIFHHPWLERSGSDIDGVVCPDPPRGIDEVSNEAAYINHITTAPVLHPMTWKVDAFVTSRLEKYRPQTEGWLKRNGFQYNKLIMSRYATAQERRAANNYGVHKGEEYKKHDWVLYIESALYQAEVIRKISGKSVFCVDVNRML